MPAFLSHDSFKFGWEINLREAAITNSLQLRAIASLNPWSVVKSNDPYSFPRNWNDEWTWSGFVWTY